MINKKENGNTELGSDQVVNSEILIKERQRVISSSVDLMMTVINSGMLIHCEDPFIKGLSNEVWKFANENEIDFRRVKLTQIEELSKSRTSVLYELMSWDDDQVLIDRYLDRLNGERISKELKAKGLKKHSSINLLTGIETQIDE